MYEAVLRCELCNKPFDKRKSLDCQSILRDAESANNVILESTLKRHGYYCRSHRPSNATKPRSCGPCVKRKSRCDNKQPQCSRCVTKGIACRYPVNTKQRAGPRVQHADDAPTTQRKKPSVARGLLNTADKYDAGNNADADVVGVLAMPNSDFTDPAVEYIDWDNSDIDLTDLWNPQLSEGIPSPSSSPSSSSTPSSTPSTDRMIQRQAISRIPSIPPTPTYSARSLIRRPKVRNGSQRIATLMMHTLNSYPLMMLGEKALPPFIHPHQLSLDVKKESMEPLSNCMSLVYMISNGAQGSRKLFWRNVQLECERLCAEVR